MRHNLRSDNITFLFNCTCLATHVLYLRSLPAQGSPPFSGLQQSKHMFKTYVISKHCNLVNNDKLITLDYYIGVKQPLFLYFLNLMYHPHYKDNLKHILKNDPKNSILHVLPLLLALLRDLSPHNVHFYTTINKSR